MRSDLDGGSTRRFAIYLLIQKHLCTAALACALFLTPKNMCQSVSNVRKSDWKKAKRLLHHRGDDSEERRCQPFKRDQMSMLLVTTTNLPICLRASSHFRPTVNN
jgi:hypothetical protein